MRRKKNPASDTDTVFLMSAEFDEYEKFLRSSAKPECQGCIVLGHATAGGAMDILCAAAQLNKRGTKIKRIDGVIEMEELRKAQQQVFDFTKDCTGTVVVDMDLGQVRSMLESLDPNNTSIDRYIGGLLPLVEECGRPKFDDE